MELGGGTCNVAQLFLSLLTVCSTTLLLFNPCPSGTSVGLLSVNNSQICFDGKYTVKIFSLPVLTFFSFFDQLVCSDTVIVLKHTYLTF